MKCTDCGYLAMYELIGDRFEYSEWNRSARFRVAHLRCYRHRWAPGQDDDSELYVQSEISRNRFICRTAFPFSEGTPAEHRISHRARTTRRWVVAGAFFGPFGAATAAGVAAQGPGLDAQATALLVAGAAAFLGVVVLAINLLFIRD